MKGCVVLVLSTALVGGCGGFIGGDQPETTTTASGGDTGEETTGGSSTGAQSTTAVSGDGSDATTTPGTDAATSDDPSTSSSTTADDGLESGSSSSTGVESFPYEGDYTGSFEGACQITVVGSLAIAVDALGTVMGSASVGGQSANVTGTVNALGTVAGNLTIPNIGQCNLTGSFNEDGLLGTGNFNCPSVACSGNWTLARI